MERQAKTAKTALKICGLTTAVDLEAIFSLGIAYAGFNFFRYSKRFITPLQARDLWQRATRSWTQRGKILSTQAVAVVVDATGAEIEAIIRDFPELAVIQCHGQESPDFLQSLRARIGGRELWKAVPVGTADDVAQAPTFAPADLILFDAKITDCDPSLKGGTGRRFDWGLLAHVSHRRWGLAGGLAPGSIAEALSLTPQPELLDVCSGVETCPGIKDPARLRLVVEELRAAMKTGSPVQRGGRSIS